MSVQLRVVLDQAGQVVDPELAMASESLTAALVATAPSGCEVAAIVPAGAEVSIAGVTDVRTLRLARRELVSAWQVGVARGTGGGLIHAPTLAAPLVRHDRVHNNDQTVVTLWDLRAWEAPDALSKQNVIWQRGMLRRAVKHADAVVVPTHEMAEALAAHASLGERIRVIAGAAPPAFSAPADGEARRMRLQLPEEYAVLTGDQQSASAGFTAAARAGLSVVVLDAPEGTEPAFADAASAAGLPERMVHVRSELEQADRAAVFASARALLATSSVSTWPWRVVEAMELGVPVIATDSGVHRDVIADGGAVIDPAEFADALIDAVGEGAKRMRVLAKDRARAFSWRSSAERVWALHAEI